jgi:hypothetical protein
LAFRKDDLDVSFEGQATLTEEGNPNKCKSKREQNSIKASVES